MKWLGKFPGLVVFVLLVGLYSVSAAKTMTGFGDSDELIAAGYNLALPHQPGYPLLTTMVFAVSHLPLASPAEMAHLLAGWLMAAAVGFVIQLVAEVSKKTNPVTLVVGGLILGSSGLVWEHGLHLEVFGLLSLVAMGLLWWGLVLKKWWFGWGLVAGLGLGHHQLLILSLIPQLIVWLRYDRRALIKGLAGIFLGLALTGLLIWLIGLRHHPDSWQLETSVVGVFRFMLRSDYSGYSMELGQELRSYFSRVEWVSVWISVKHYLLRMWTYWGIFGLAGLFGVVWGYRRLKSGYWVILGGFMLSGPILAGYISLPAYPESSVEQLIGLATLERMYVLSQLYWGVWVGLGLVYVGRWLPKWSGVVWLGLVLIVMVRLLPQRSLADYTAADEYMAAVFGQLPENSSLICVSDLSCFGSYFYQSVYRVRPDVKVIANASQFRSGRKPEWSFGGFNYPDNPFRLGEAIGRSTLIGEPIFITQLNAVWTEELGLDGQGFFLVPDGHYRLEIVRQPQPIVEYSGEGEAVAVRMVTKQWPEYTYAAVLRAVLAEQHALNAIRLVQSDKLVLAQSEIGMAQKIQGRTEYLAGVEATVNSYQISSDWLKWVNEDDFRVKAAACRKQQDIECELRYLSYWVWRNPNLAEPRLGLAAALARADLDALADRELKHVQWLNDFGYGF